RVSVGRASGPMSVRTTSGRVSVGLDGPAEVDAETVSGRISVDVAPGLGVRMVESAGRRVENSAAAGDDCTIRTKAVNGRIQVRNR
ncbi:MAG: hypothetical protein OEW42_08185, partial [Acidimicrobiia bacterium]|nr:hypothetical protein [Acidimicrobiia bacterium]